MAHITRTGDGWTLAGATYATLTLALGTPAIEPLMPDSQARWISASVEGMELVTSEVLTALSLDVATRAIRRPVDGGRPDSEPHATAYRSDALATGWVHAAHTVTDGPRTELMVYAELLPDVAARRDEGRLAYASIYAQVMPDGVGSLFHSLAMTNLPLDPSVAASTIARSRTSTPALVQAAQRPTGTKEYKMDEQPTDAAEAVMTLEEAMTALDEAKAEIAALKTELEALTGVAMSATQELVAARQAAPVESADDVVGAAVKDGRITQGESAVYLALARASIDKAKTLLAARTPLLGRVVSPKQSPEHAARAIVAGDVKSEAEALLNALPCSPSEKAKYVKHLRGNS